MIPVLILAAGASSRMRGRDKLLEPVDGQPLLARQVAAAQSLGAPVYVTLPPAPHPRYAQIATATAIPVPDAATGISASLRAGIRALPAQTEAVLVLLADLPELTADDLGRVVSARSLHPDAKIWRATTDTGQHGHPIVFDASLFPEFTGLTGDQGAQRIITKYRDNLHPVPLQGERATTDLDTPEDWAAWRSRTGR